MEIQCEIVKNKSKIMNESIQINSECQILQKKNTTNQSQKVSQYHSQCLNHVQQNSSKSQKMPKLYFLLLKFKLQQLGFRKYQYEQFLSTVEINGLSMEKIRQNVIKICQKIIAEKELQHLSIKKPPQFHEQSLIIQQKPIQIQIIKKQNFLFICPVCFDEIYQSSFVKYLQCGHKFCDNCIRATIQQSIRQAKYQILCLQIHCQTHISQKLIENALSPSILQRYRYFKKKKLLQSDPNNKFCTKPNCEGILETIQKKKNCFVCKSQYCNTCLRPIHQGDCETNIQNVIQQVYVNLKIKKCPKCKSPIEKSDGCNHMTCKKCNFEFCWLCLGGYSKYHYRYYNCFGCPGMQFQQQEDRVKQRLKQLIFFLLLPMIISILIAIFLIGLPLYMIIMIITRPYRKAMQSSYYDPCCSCCESCQCCQDMAHWGCKCFLMFFVYMIEGILYGIFVAPFKYFSMVYYQVIEIFD